MRFLYDFKIFIVKTNKKRQILLSTCLKGERKKYKNWEFSAENPLILIINIHLTKVNTNVYYKNKENINMALTQKEYEELREKVISKYRILYKDNMAMDMCEVPKEARIRMFEDPYYISKTKAIKATLFAQQLEIIDEVLAGTYTNSEKPTDQSANILKALDQKQKLLFEDLNVNKDESNALNVAFMALTKEEFDAIDTVEVNEGSNESDDLGVDFTAGSDKEDSFENRLKKDVEKRLNKLEEEENGN